MYTIICILYVQIITTSQLLNMTLTVQLPTIHTFNANNDEIDVLNINEFYESQKKIVLRKRDDTQIITDARDNKQIKICRQEFADSIKEAKLIFSDCADRFAVQNIDKGKRVIEVFQYDKYKTYFRYATQQSDRTIMRYEIQDIVAVNGNYAVYKNDGKIYLLDIQSGSSECQMAEQLSKYNVVFCGPDSNCSFKIDDFKKYFFTPSKYKCNEKRIQDICNTNITGKCLDFIRSKKDIFSNFTQCNFTKLNQLVNWEKSDIKQLKEDVDKINLENLKDIICKKFGEFFWSNVAGVNSDDILDQLLTQ